MTRRGLGLAFAAAIAVTAAGAATTMDAQSPAAAPVSIAFSLPGATGLIEGIAHRPKTGAWYFGDVHQRAVWRRASDGTVTRFTALDERLLGIFRVIVDEPRGALWVAMGALPHMAGFTEAQKGLGGIAEIDLERGTVRRVVTAPRDGGDHLLGDMTLLADGTIYATDTTSPILWRLPAGQNALDVVVRGAPFKSLQGITTTADGRGLLVTDYPTGVMYVDPAARTARTLTAPAGAEVRGIDTLLRAPDGSLIAVQNGTKTQRILRLSIDAGATAIAAVATLAEHPAMVDATLGTLVDGAFVVIADGGWNRFEPPKVDVTPRDVPVLRVALPGK